MSRSPSPRISHDTVRLNPSAGVICAALALVAAVGPAAGTEIVPLDELTPGDLCVARTVFQGTEIEEFNIGQSIIARSVFSGLADAVKEMKRLSTRS